MLQKFLDAEKRILDAEKIKHAPTIGGMYEGLSRNILDQAIPIKGLSVESGFIEDSTGKQSDEIDCMLVMGEGRKLPYIDKRVYSIDNVIAVVQVKKNLYTKDISEGFDNLRSVLELEPPKVQRKIQTTVRRSFEQITRTPLREAVGTLPEFQQEIYRSLKIEAAWPVRILLGYHGFKSENTFRAGLLKHLQTLESKPGWGPPSLPSFIIGPNASAFKNTAMPFGAPLIKSWWPLFLTSGKLQPSFVLLEAVWTRLNHLGMINFSIFGEDLGLEEWGRLVDARLRVANHWEFDLWPARLKAKGTGEAIQEWKPAIVSLAAYVIANMLCKHDPEPVNLSGIGSPEETEPAADELIDAGVAARDLTDRSRLYLITEECGCVILPDGRFAVGENNTGRLFRWAKKQLDIHRRNQRKGQSAEGAQPEDKPRID